MVTSIVLMMDPVYSQEHKPLSDAELAELRKEYNDLHLKTGMHERRLEVFRKILREERYRPVRQVKMFYEPTVFIKGTVEEIGINREALEKYVALRFLNSFAFLQSDFHFKDTLTPSEMGFFECEVPQEGRYN